MPSIITPQEIAARPTLTSFRTYEEAQAAVDKSSDNKFPVEHVSIIGATCAVWRQCWVGCPGVVPPWAD